MTDQERAYRYWANIVPQLQFVGPDGKLSTVESLAAELTAAHERGRLAGMTEAAQLVDDELLSEYDHLSRKIRAAATQRKGTPKDSEGYNSSTDAISTSLSEGARQGPSEQLLYCGKCNQRRYFVNGKCEMCAATMHEEKWRTYEREYILPCFEWAKEYGIDLQQLVREQSGKNCVELLIRAMATQRKGESDDE